MTATAQTTDSACTRDTCFAPDLACVLGRDDCEHLTSATPAEVPVEDEAGQVLPWSGASLGLSDLFPVVALGRPRVVGLVGAAGSGKTTLLAAHWIAARRGLGQFGRAFAGSYSLSGWHQIARHLQWVPKGSGFPPHTAAVDERSPALLHTSVSADRETPHHVLFTDAPGEWFSRWAEVSAEAPGAQWVANHSDVFIILADADALSGNERGKARGAYVALAHQLASAAAGRTVVPVLTKADVAVPEPILEQVEKLNARLFDAETMKVSAHDTSFSSITAAVEAGVDAALTPRFATPGRPAEAWAHELAPTLRRGRA